MLDEKTVHIPDEWLVPTVPNEEALAERPGRYRLCFEVAAGGMATVYLALYQGPMGFEKVVALKKIHKHLAREKQFVEMFFDEARIAAHVDHPHVCKVVDFGQSQDTYYLAMEYLLGEPLSRVWHALEEHPALAASPELPLLVSRIAADLLEGLHAAHELTDAGGPMGIIHRDVTPANLFVLYDGSVRVVDFGIAKAENKIPHTETGTVKGKYAYVAPEQLALKPLDRRCDIWAMGVVLWEMITGRRLFKREGPMDTMKAVTEADIPPPSSVREHIPSDLDDIVLKALRRRREERFATAREMSVALEHMMGAQERTVPAADVSEWLAQLFPGAAARKRQLIELTRKGDTAVPVDGDREEHAATALFKKQEPTAMVDRESRPEISGDDAELLDEEEGTDEPIRASGPRARLPASRETSRRGPRLDVDEDTPRTPRRPPTRPSGPARWPLVVGGALAVIAGAAIAALGSEGGATGQSVEPQIEDQRTDVDDPSRPGEGDTDPDEDPEDRGSGTSDEEIEEDGEPPFVPDDPGASGPTGRVQVTTRGGGWGELHYLSHVYGRTPQTVELPVGRHRLLLYPHGEGLPRPLDVEVRPDRRVWLNVTVSARE